MASPILLALDLGDPDSVKRVLPIAENFASKEGAELHVVCVIPGYSMPLVGSFFPEGFQDKAIEAAKTALAEALQAEAENPSAIKAHLVQGTIYDEIMKMADKLDVSLIIMESHRPALKDYLLGPNAARVVRHAKQSVYVVRH
jgi:nucleotide-binding universal stress UspA family protein